MAHSDAMKRLLQRLQTGWAPRADEIEPAVPQVDALNWQWNFEGAGTIVPLGITYETLDRKTSTALLTAKQRENPGEVRKTFVDLTRASLDFRVFFRNTEVSEITMHNAFNRALRDVLGLDRMQAEFSGDVAEILAFLERQAFRERAEAEHRRATRFWFLGVLGTGILAALSVGTLLTQVLENRPMFLEMWERPLATLQNNEASQFIGLLAGLLVLIGACFIGYLKRPQENGASLRSEGDVFAEEAGKDFIIHRARE
jgi:hypothetical protein